MIATPEQYRTLADLIERGGVVGTIMLGRDMIVARPDNPARATKASELIAIKPDGCFGPVEFERPIQ